MKRSERKQKRSAFKRCEAGLRAILNDWDFIGGSPEDEYDCLAHRILSVLERQGASIKEIANVINSECVEHFGVDVSSKEVEVISAKIAQWWQGSRGA